MRSTMPRFQGENLKKNLELVDALADIASSRRVSRGQLALAWLLAKGSDIAPIPGTKRVRYLEENVAAAEVSLSADEVRRLDELFAAGKVAGARYNEAGMRSLDRD